MTLQQQEQKEIDTNKPTKHYDEVAMKVRKLLSASVQTFIPELADGLRKDWCPELSDEQIRKNLRLQKVIRNKIFDEWSKEGGYSEDNIWKEVTIVLWFPKWLRNPIQEEASQEPRAKAAEAIKQKQMRKQLISDNEKNKLTTFATNLPKTVIPPPEPEPSYEGEDLDLEGGRLATYGASGKTISQMKGDITNHAAKLFEALTEIDHMPHKDEDLTVDYIKPTRQYRKSLILELDDQSRKSVWNYLGSVEAAIQDMLDLLEEEMKK